MTPELPSLLESWVIHLKAERKSVRTVRSYHDSVAGFIAWCDRAGHSPRLGRDIVSAFMVDQMDSGMSPKTVRIRHGALRQFAAWLVAEGEMVENEVARIAPPKLDQKVMPRLSNEDCVKLIAACKGTAFVDRRDEAVIRLMLESALRASEVIAMAVEDVDLPRGLAVIQRGKGGKARIVPFGVQTARALDRYLRVRRSHPLAHTTHLWLGDRGHYLGYSALYKSLVRRGSDLGHVHPHLTRHTAAHRWLEAGGSEQGLMAVAGWESRAMLDRYTKSQASQRAVEESRKLNLGEL